jgi:hypothetical protein
VTRDSDYHRLEEVALPYKVPDFLCGFIAIHYGHGTIHEYESIAVLLLMKCILNQQESLLATVGCVDYLIDVLYSTLR